MFYFAAACSDRHACAAYLCVAVEYLCIQTKWWLDIYGVPEFMVAVVGVNYDIYLSIFPEVDFIVTGYPLTFIAMLTASTP